MCTQGYRLLILTLLLGTVAACGGNGGNNDVPSANADLRSLVIEDATLDPSFSAATTSYRADVAYATAATRVIATTDSSRASVTVNGTTTPSGVASAVISLPVGDTPIVVVVTAEDGATQTYRVQVTRPPPGTDASLRVLALSAGPLDQIFDPVLTSYTAGVGHLAASTRVLATPTDPNATMIIAGADVTTGEPSPPLPLAVGDTDLSIEVAAEDGVTRRTYDVTVTRDALASLAQQAYVKATNTDADDRFGYSLALVGDTLLAAAPYEQSLATGVDGDQAGNTGSAVGAVYLYERSATTWAATHYLKASNSNDGDRFGWSVAATEDALVVGAPNEQSRDGTESDNSGNAVGAAYVFDPDVAGAPAQIDYLKASNPDDLDRFGSAVAAAPGRILVGAPQEASNSTGVNGNGADNSHPGAGAAYLFESTAGDFTQVAYLKASNADSGTDSQFGNAVALSGDTMAVGAWRESSGATGVGGDQSDTSQPASGAVYVFEANAAAWSQTAYVKASNAAQGDNFGAAVALDGDLLAVGAPGEDSAEQDSGAVYVFARDAGGSWTQEAFLKAQIPGMGDLFGSQVTLAGNLLAVGAIDERSDGTGINPPDTNENAVSSGAVYLFERDGTGSWSQIAFVKPGNTDPGDRFGWSLAFAGDTLAVGARNEQSNARGVDGNPLSNALSGAGAVYLFR
jgi:hypothetical protein